MKKKSIIKKLVLNKQVIADLNNSELKNVKGGNDIYLTKTCDTWCNCYTNYPMNNCN